MHEAALKDDVDPDEISFVHTVRVIRRKMAAAVSFPPLRTLPNFMRPFCVKSWKTEWSPVEVAVISEGLSEK